MSLLDFVYGSSNELLKFPTNQPSVLKGGIFKYIFRYWHKSDLSFWEDSQQFDCEPKKMWRNHILAPKLAIMSSNVLDFILKGHTAFNYVDI